MPPSKQTLPDRSLLTQLAGRIVDLGLTVPAVFFLEMSKPVAFLGSQALVFFGPIITAFIRTDPYYRLAELLEDRDNVEFLIQEIERLEKTGSPSEKEDL